MNRPDRVFDPNIGQFRDKGRFDGSGGRSAQGGMQALSRPAVTTTWTPDLLEVAEIEGVDRASLQALRDIMIQQGDTQGVGRVDEMLERPSAGLFAGYVINNQRLYGTVDTSAGYTIDGYLVDHNAIVRTQVQPRHVTTWGQAHEQDRIFGWDDNQWGDYFAVNSHRTWPLERVEDMDPNIGLPGWGRERWWDVAARSTSPDNLRELGRHPDEQVRARVAANPNTTVVELLNLSGDPDPAVREVVARNPRTPAGGLWNLRQGWDVRTRRALAQNPASPPELLGEAFMSHDVYPELAKNPGISQGLLHRIAARERDPNIMSSIAHNPNVSAKTAVLAYRNAAQFSKDHDVDHGLLMEIQEPLKSRFGLEYEDFTLDTPETAGIKRGRR